MSRVAAPGAPRAFGRVSAAAAHRTARLFLRGLPRSLMAAPLPCLASRRRRTSSLAGGAPHPRAGSPAADHHARRALPQAGRQGGAEERAHLHRGADAPGALRRLGAQLGLLGHGQEGDGQPARGQGRAVGLPGQGGRSQARAAAVGAQAQVRACPTRARLCQLDLWGTEVTARRTRAAPAGWWRNCAFSPPTHPTQVAPIPHRLRSLFAASSRRTSPTATRSCRSGRRASCPRAWAAARRSRWCPRRSPCPPPRLPRPALLRRPWPSRLPRRPQAGCPPAGLRSPPPRARRESRGRAEDRYYTPDPVCCPTDMRGRTLRPVTSATRRSPSPTAHTPSVLVPD